MAKRTQHVAANNAAIVWPEFANAEPTILRNVVLKYCDRLATPCKCRANNVATCCVEILRSFGRR